MTFQPIGGTVSVASPLFQQKRGSQHSLPPPTITNLMGPEKQGFLPQRVQKFISGSQVYQLPAWLSVNRANIAPGFSAFWESSVYLDTRELRP